MKAKWKQVTLNDVVDTLGDGIHGTPKYSVNGKYAFINGNNLVDGQIQIKDSTKFVDIDEYSKHKKPLSDRTIFVSINGTLGNIAMYRGEKVILGKSACYFNVSKNICKDYIRFVVMSPDFRNYLQNQATGTTIKNISLKQMREYPFLLPPFEIQKTIASILSALDDKIELNKKINENLEQQAQAIYKQMFIDNESTIPATMADVALNITDGVHNTVRDDPEGNFLLLSCKNIKNGSLSISSTERRISKDTFEKLRRRTKLHKGDVLISSVGTVGELLMLNTDPINYEFQRSVAIVKPNPEIISSVYLYESLVFQKAKLINAAHGAVQQCLFISDIAEFPISIPYPKELQRFNDIVVPIFDIISVNETENQRLVALRDALLPRLMSGELDVSDLDI